ncbi:MAG: ABC transporter permease [Phycisphaerae bacterium]
MSTIVVEPAKTDSPTATPTRRAPSGPGFVGRSWVLARRELFSYFVSPIAYVAMFLFLIASGFAFAMDFAPGQPAQMRHLFEWMLWFLTVIVPVLCMGAISQEWASGTIETLMTAPVTDAQVVAGKFVGAFGFLAVLIAPTLIYVGLLAGSAQPRLDLGPVISGYLGMLLAGALFVAVSLFCSSLTKSQVVAAFSAFAILALITILPWLVGSWALLPNFWRAVVGQAVYARYADFSKGIIDTGHVAFFVLSTGVFLFLTTKVLESRRWK